jgi:hypothetical protein
MQFQEIFTSFREPHEIQKYTPLVKRRNINVETTGKYSDHCVLKC